MLWTGNCGSAAWGSEREDPCTSGTKAWRIVVPQMDRVCVDMHFLANKPILLVHQLLNGCVYTKQRLKLGCKQYSWESNTAA